jgi:uncharacterized damage-inducible protein DinB
MEVKMFRQIDDFLKDYENLTKGTLKIFEKLSDATLDQSESKDHHTIRQIAWHIVTTMSVLMHHVGITISSIDQDSSPPNSTSEIAATYKKATKELIDIIKANWTDETLVQTDDMYGEQWPRGILLTVLINHEIHHRGQITALLYQAGYKVPSIFVFPFRSYINRE